MLNQNFLHWSAENVRACVLFLSYLFCYTNNFSHNLSTEISNENETSVLSFLIQFELGLLQDFLHTSTFIYVTPICFGRRSGGEKIYYVFDNQFPAALKRLQFEKHLAMENVKKLITQADGYQPHLIAPEQGYRRLIESCLVSIKGPAEAAVDAVSHSCVDMLNNSHFI